MQDRVRELFEEVQGKKEGDDFVVIDAGGSMEDVQREIQQKTRAALERVDGEGKALRTVGAW